MNKYYCKNGHQNFAIDGKRPKICKSCSISMELEISKPLKASTLVEGFSRSSSGERGRVERKASQYIKNQNNYNNFRQEEEEELDITNDLDLDGLSFSVEGVGNVNASTTIENVACGQPLGEQTKRNKMTKKQSKNTFRILMEAARSKTESKEI